MNNTSYSILISLFFFSNTKSSLSCLIRTMKRKRTRKSIRDFCRISAGLQKGISEMSKAVEQISEFVKDNGKLLLLNYYNCLTMNINLTINLNENMKQQDYDYE